ncbi:hypothetical protein H4N58_08750 [Mumia sp. ZJ1417]|uniref:hypothetical protein n=1 Tax=Mumia sp. ZJ1417 TaxID=2708082 RepID=UPI001421AACA|nr:hypothetical protein [Mumia sp. ZJ1417]QMW67918.1 hypothetical protein H4N58_08750 [Mumia sp. ZJ1417]
MASGHIHEFEAERTGEIREEFVARTIGHNATKTAYRVQRRRLNSVESPLQPTSGLPSPAVGL